MKGIKRMNLLLSLGISLLFSWFNSLQGYAQPHVPSHQDMMRQESLFEQFLNEQLPQRLPEAFVIPNQEKAYSERVSDLDITEVNITFDTIDTLPSSATVRMYFTAVIDDLSEFSLFLRGPDLDTLTINYSRNGESWQQATILYPNYSSLQVSLPETLNIGEQAMLEFSTVLDWSELLQFPRAAYSSEQLSHLFTSYYIPLSGTSFRNDSFKVTTVIPSLSGQHPVGLGRVLSRPNSGRPGVWTYQTEINSDRFVFGLGATYPTNIDGRVEIFDPPNTLGAIDHSVIAQAMTEVIEVYERLYGPFPFERLGAYPLTEEAGVAKGPQAQIFLPWFFWLEDYEQALRAWSNPIATIYHEVAHQYFYNMVRLTPVQILGQAWLSEAMAEFSSIRALEELGGDGRLNRWQNYYSYMFEVEPSTEVPVASDIISGEPWYTEIVYFRGAQLVYGIYQRMDDFTEKLRACVEYWRGLFISADDMFTCFNTMNPKEEYTGFDVDEYIERYFRATTRDQITVEARFIDDMNSALLVSGHQANDFLEVYRYKPWGEMIKAYIDRLPEQELIHSDSAWLIDPQITTPRIIVNQHPDDVDLNGVVDGQDALDVLFERGKSLNTLDAIFPQHLDVDQDGVISDRDLTDIQRNMGQTYR